MQGKLFDSDRRYHYLGFSIDDVGACDVCRKKYLHGVLLLLQIINSVNWSETNFVGTIFTDAPYDCLIVKQIVREVNREEGEEEEDADEETLLNPIRR